MKKIEKLFLFICLTIFLINTSYSITCYCGSITECENKITDPNCDTINFTYNSQGYILPIIINQDISNKIINCNNYNIYSFIFNNNLNQNITIKNCKIYQPDTGIIFNGYAALIKLENIILNSNKYGVYFNKTGIGIIFNSDTISVNNGPSIYFNDASSSISIQNTILSGEYGIVINGNISYLNLENITFNVGQDYFGSLNNANYLNIYLDNNFYGKTNHQGYSETCDNYDGDNYCDIPFNFGSFKDIHTIAKYKTTNINTNNYGCVMITVSTTDRNISYSLKNNCGYSINGRVLIFNDYIPGRKPLLNKSVNLPDGSTYSEKFKIPDRFVGKTSFKIVVIDPNQNNKVVGEIKSFIYDVPQKNKVSQNYLTVIVIIITAIFIVYRNKKNNI